MDQLMCRYDWLEGFQGARLGCVAPHKHGDKTTVILRGGRTLVEMLALGILTGEAFADAARLGTAMGALESPCRG